MSDDFLSAHDEIGGIGPSPPDGADCVLCSGERGQYARHFHFLRDFPRHKELADHLWQRVPKRQREELRQYHQASIDATIAWRTSIEQTYRDTAPGDGIPVPVWQAWSTPDPPPRPSGPHTQRGRAHAVQALIRLCGHSAATPVSQGYLPLWQAVDQDALADAAAWAEVTGMCGDFAEAATDAVIPATITVPPVTRMARA
jgi:hypothetical protein